MTIIELEQRLRAHDHYYAYASDSNIVLAGQADREEIIAAMQSLPGKEVARLIRECIPFGARQSWIASLVRLNVIK